ncbi:MAG: MGMT family protein [Propionicimonas sp.]
MGVVAEVTDQVLLAVSLIPPGRVTSYKSIGLLVGCGPRVVARVLATDGGSVCWWRVVHADGTIAAHLVERARAHLASEGVVVQGNRVDFGRHGVSAG